MKKESGAECGRELEKLHGTDEGQIGSEDSFKTDWLLWTKPKCTRDSSGNHGPDNASEQ